MFCFLWHHGIKCAFLAHTTGSRYVGQREHFGYNKLRNADEILVALVFAWAVPTMIGSGSCSFLKSMRIEV